MSSCQGYRETIDTKRLSLIFSSFIFWIPKCLSPPCLCVDLHELHLFYNLFSYVDILFLVQWLWSKFLLFLCNIAINLTNDIMEKIRPSIFIQRC